MSKAFIKLLSLNITLVILALIAFYFYPFLGLLVLIIVIGFDINKVYNQSKERQSEKIYERKRFEFELSETEKTIENQEAQLEALLNNIDSPIFFIDNNHNLSYYNIPFQKNFKFTESNLVDYLQILPNELVKYIDDAQFLNTSTEHSIKINQKYYQFISHPIKNNQDYFLGNIFILNDITSIEYSKRAQRHFIAYASHELKTPIAAIRGAIEILINHDNIPDDDKIDFQNMIIEQTEKMNILVSDLLDLSKLESDSYHLDYSLVSINNLITETLKPFEQEIAKQQLTISINSNDLKFYVDQFRMKQVFTNIISNAIKFSHPNGTIALSITESKNNYQIQITDNGIGISSKDIKKVFDPFYTITSRDQSSGTGLGLTIVKTIIGLHDGSIDITSKKDSGTTVSILIPKKYILEKELN
ncbi:sensor histidine kinase [Culicoidibacter larvae]|uniref:histidine kinase n=1 Tax=Culicoidibacter larvae TaxID=2579976 RepID=A0A5R8QHN5_9FIRM|nr:ATP-binding protein [Culicoidibacter larvae]TLG77190.1 GHKL domain-containing protein [Culicoidibacter larvae]